MKKPFRIALAVCLLALAAHPPSAAQAPVDDQPLTEIAGALSRIAAVMEKQLESSRLDLLMRRQDLSQRRLDRVESQLSTAERSIQGHRQNVARMEMELARFSDPDVAESMGWDAVSYETQMAHLEFELDSSRAQIGQLEADIARLEQEKARRQRELEDWQAFMDRELSGLQ